MIGVTTHFEHSLTAFREKLFNGMSVQTKIILLVAAVALAILVSALLAWRYFYNGKGADTSVVKEIKPVISDVSVKLSPISLAAWPVDDAKTKSVESKVTLEDKDEPLSKPEKKALPADDSKAEKTESAEALPTAPKKDPAKKAKPVLMPDTRLSMGKVRVSVTPGDPPSFMGTQTGDITIIDSDKLITAAFACCFHTSESHQEIYQLLMAIRKKMDPYPEEHKHYAESFHNLYNNFVHLHDAILGEIKAKAFKIYWSEAVENELIPYLFTHANVDIKRLVFAVIPGEVATSPFQAPAMDFKHQLQFIKIEKDGGDAVIKPYYKMVKKLSHEVLGKKNILSFIDLVLVKIVGEDIHKKGDAFPLVKNAYLLTFLLNAHQKLQAMKGEGKKVDFDELTSAEQEKFLLNLLEKQAT